MAGNRVRRELEEWIDVCGGQEWLFDRISEGESLSQLARELGTTRPQLSRWCNEACRQAAYRHARRDSAGALVDRGMEIIDGTHWRETQKARNQAEYRKWLAGVYNDEYATDKGKPGQTINIEQLHIGALQQAHEHAASRTIEHQPADLPDWAE